MDRLDALPPVSAGGSVTSLPLGTTPPKHRGCPQRRVRSPLAFDWRALCAVAGMGWTARAASRPVAGGHQLAALLRAGYSSSEAWTKSLARGNEARFLRQHRRRWSEGPQLERSLGRRAPRHILPPPRRASRTGRTPSCRAPITRLFDAACGGEQRAFLRVSIRTLLYVPVHPLPYYK